MSDDIDDDIDVEVEDEDDLVLDGELADDALDDDTEVLADTDDIDDDTDAGEADDDVPLARRPAKKTDDDEDDDEGLDLEEEHHPDDVEVPLDALLQERTAKAALDDDEEDFEDAEDDDRGDGPTRIVPRRPGEFLCSSCFLVLPRHQLADEARMLCRDCA